MKSDYTHDSTNLGLLDELANEQKNYPKNRNIHRPFHLRLPKKTFFITNRTIDRKCYLYDDERKEVFYQTLIEAIKMTGVKMVAWVILSNHYHLQFFAEETKQVSRLIQILHSKSTVILNKLDNQPGRKMWYQYRDWIIRNDRDLYIHFNYIHHNPVKHGLVATQDEVINYKFCSYKKWLETKGQEYMDNLFESYPVKNFNKEI